MTTSPPRADSRVTPERVSRRAIVYVRQSSPGQVKHNRESQELQYALASRARDFGWTEVEVIDEDLGKSAGAAAATRHGFERLLAAVTLGDVGVVLSREVSRLSRTDRDWCRLLEVCQLFDTLIADADHVYDLTLLDDQLILGIKGTLSVVELKVLKLRMLQGMANKARRGELYRMVAPGYVVDDAQLVKDPNRRVQEAVALVFDKFRELGTIRQTFRWFHDNGVELPVNERKGGRLHVVFKRPTMSFVGDVLHNAIYAGAYVYGRRPVEVVLVDGAPRKRQGRQLAPEEARVFIRDHHEGYIDWATFEENRRLMRNNTHRHGNDDTVGAARCGQGILAGLVRCRRCGRKLHVRYWGKSGTAARYLCKGDYDVGGAYCLGFGASTVDKRFGEEILRVLSPLGVDASLLAINNLASKDDERQAALKRKLEQAEYDAARAREQFDQVDARNRLVAAELERRWNERLRVVIEVQAEVAALDDARDAISDDELAAITALGAQFSEVWHNSDCPPSLKKRIIRTVVREVVVDEQPAGNLQLVIHWRGGAHTAFEMPKPTSGIGRKTDLEDLDVIRRMAARYGDDEIARVLNKLGRRTGAGKRWNQTRVGTARKNHGITGQQRRAADDDVLTMNAAARYARVSDTTIRRLVEAGVLRCEQLAPFAPWEIRREHLDTAPVGPILERVRTTGKLVLDEGAFEAQAELFDVKSAT